MKINPGKGMKSKKPPYHYTNKQTNGQQAITLKPFIMDAIFIFGIICFAVVLIPCIGLFFDETFNEPKTWEQIRAERKNK